MVYSSEKGRLSWDIKNDSESALGVGVGGSIYIRVRPPEHCHNTSPKRSVAAESSVHQVPRDTAMPDADDFELPALEPEEGPLPVLEFDVVPEPESLPEAVSSPEISEKKKNGYR